MGSVSLASTGFQVLMIGRRRQDISPAQPRAHIENVHIALVKMVSGDACPLQYQHCYVQREANCTSGGSRPVAVLDGTTQANVDYDAVEIRAYRDKAHFESNWVYSAGPEKGKVVRDDAAKLSSPSEPRAPS
ncbi:hypothetical protein PG990_007338 [Apiospora arundinis]